MRLVRRLFLLLFIALLLAATLLLWRMWPDLAPSALENTRPVLTNTALIEKGRYLATAGNCIACHTRPGGAPYAGGRRIDTPFGAVYSSNLTPDDEHGLGRWTTTDFARAMRQGRSRDGRLLYPAFPYTHYSRVTRRDNDAILAYLKSLPPSRQAPPAHDLRFPFNTRIALMVWRALFFEPGEFRPDSQRSDVWNRGAYLVEGLGHCSACHGARGALGQILESADYAGGQIPGLRWTAPALAPSHEMTDERADEIVELLKTGVSARNATTGPMAEVVFHSLQYLEADDLRAMVEYIRSLPAAPFQPVTSGIRVTPADAEELIQQGKQLYGKHCADCHGDSGEGQPYRYPALAGNPMVTSASVSNVIRSVLEGGFAPSTAANPRPFGMPSYAQQFTAEETAAVISFIRQAWGNNAPAVSPLDVNRR